MTSPSESLTKLIEQFYANLNELYSRFGEDLTDTDVREALGETLDFYFAWGQTDPRGYPQTYEMMTEEGDKALAPLVAEFLEKSIPLAEEAQIPPGVARLRLLQLDAPAGSGALSYDFFIGHSDAPIEPKPLWEGRFGPGDYDDDDDEL